MKLKFELGSAAHILGTRRTYLASGRGDPDQLNNILVRKHDTE